MFRQGDLIFKKLEKLPKGVGKGKELRSVVLAEGEFTGHKHLLEAETPVVFYGKQVMVEEPRYLVVKAPAVVRHQEHKEVKLPEGIYEVTAEREYNYFEQTAQVQRD